MSRLGKKPLPIPAAVEVKIQGDKLHIKGPKGELAINAPPGIAILNESGCLKFTVKSGQNETGSAMLGLVRGLVTGMLEGVVKGYTKELEIQGVGFKASVEGKNLLLFLGYASPKKLDIPAGISVKVTDNTNISISGIDKQLVGDYAARIRAVFPAEPYKGKGIRYKGEYVRRKVGKTVA